jgi:hypothetical protein
MNKGVFFGFDYNFDVGSNLGRKIWMGTLEAVEGRTINKIR